MGASQQRLIGVDRRLGLGALKDEKMKRMNGKN
jgi:hypothetical protein